MSRQLDKTGLVYRVDVRWSTNQRKPPRELVRSCRTACVVLWDGDLSGPRSGQSYDETRFSRNFGLMDDQLPVGGLQRTIPDSNRLEISSGRFFLISDVLGTSVFARTHLGRSGLNWISNDYFLFFGWYVVLFFIRDNCKKNKFK